MLRSLFTSVVSTLALLSLTTVALGVQPGERTLPATTKALVQVPDLDQLRAKWDETQLGQLAKDPVIRPFAEDLRKQIQFKLSKTGVRLGLTLEDLQGVASGEISLAVIQPEGDKKQHALAIIADISGHQAEARSLLAKISQNMANRGAVRTAENIGGIDVTIYTVPRKNKELKPLQVYQFIVEDQLFALDHPAEAVGLIRRLAGANEQTLADTPEYQVAMQRCEQDADNLVPHFRWFIEPFGYTETIRAASADAGHKHKGTDILAVLKNQGFTAIRSIGGHVVFATGEHEMLYRAFVFAPEISNPNDPNSTGFQAAARMLDFPAGGRLQPQSWIPRNLATYWTFNWKLQQAFEHAKGLVDELAGEEVFEEVLDGIKHDPKGPQIDIRKELIAHLGQRATIIADHKVPITPQSQRIMIAIELTNSAVVSRTLDKAMETDPNARKREFQGQIIWEMVEEETPDFSVSIDGPPGLGPFGNPPAEEEKDRPIMPNSAMTVVHNHLIFATHIDFIRDLVKDIKERHTLSESADYQAVSAALERLGAGDDSFRFFGRLDEAYRPAYELIRQGKMPQSETLLGRLLNAVLAPEEEDRPRQQQIDGSKMPDFQVVRRYLGPMGLFVKTEGSGWYIAGCVLSKDAE